MGNSLIGIGISSLMANQTALEVASQNIANANQPYYTRRTVDFSPNPFNSGVNVADVRRIVDDNANQYLQASNSNLAQANLYLQQMQGFEPLLDDNDTKVGAFIARAQSTLTQVAAGSITNGRSQYMNNLSQLANQFQSVNNTINQQVQHVNLSLQTEVTQVNSILRDLSRINQQLSNNQLGDQSTLMDQQQGLVQQLAKYINFTTQTDPTTGVVQACLSNGMPLLTNNQPATFAMTPNAADASHLDISVQIGSTTEVVNNYIQSGEISGWMNYRTNGLDAAQHGLDRLALVFAQTMNTQNKLGVVANGMIGSNIFDDINTTTAITNRAIANSHNTGSSPMTVSVDDTAKLTTSDYQLTIGSGSSYTLRRTSDNAVVSSGTIGSLPQTIDVDSTDGFSITLPSGTFSAGDQYTISPTKNAANAMNLSITDPSQLALGWPVIANAGTIADPGQLGSGSDGKIEVTSITDTTTSAFTTTPGQLTPPLEIVFSVSSGVTTYTLRNASTHASIEGPIPYDPSTTPPTGKNVFPTPGAYDPGFRVQVTGNTIKDGEAMSNLYQSNTVLGDNSQLVTYGTAYDQLSGDISVKTQSAQQAYTTAQGVQAQAAKQRDYISGVSLEEETLNLSKFQAAYQASAQILQTARTVFDMILQLSRS